MSGICKPVFFNFTFQQYIAKHRPKISNKPSKATLN